MKKFIVSLAVPAVALAALAGGSLAGAQTPTEGARATPDSVTWKATPTRDSRSPYTFTVTGRVNMPPGPPGQSCPPGQSTGSYCQPLPRERACDNGRVAVRYKAGSKHTKTVSLRRVATRSRGSQGQPPFCTFSSTVRFTEPERLRPNGQLKVAVRFLGNAYYTAKQGPTRFVRAEIPRRRGR